MGKLRQFFQRLFGQKMVKPTKRDKESDLLDLRYDPMMVDEEIYPLDVWIKWKKGQKDNAQPDNVELLFDSDEEKKPGDDKL